MVIILLGKEIKTVTYVYKFKDPNNEVYRQARNGLSTDFLVKKFEDRLVEKKKVEGNTLLNEGKGFMLSCLVNGYCSPPFDHDHAYIGVGDSDVPEDPTQQGLQGTNKCYKSMDFGYPYVSGGKAYFRATFPSNECNFHWLEWTVANGPGDNYINLNRRVEDLGTKTSDYTWVLEVVMG